MNTNTRQSEENPLPVEHWYGLRRRESFVANPVTPLNLVDHMNISGDNQRP
jgi:hypothetical protein